MNSMGRAEIGTGLAGDQAITGINHLRFLIFKVKPIYAPTAGSNT